MSAMEIDPCTELPSSRACHQDGRGQRATLETWLSPPANKWSFRHARELFWSERVAATKPVHLQPVGGLDIDPTLSSYLQRSHSDAFVVLHRGRLVAEWYAQGVSPDDRHILFSVTKSVVGLVASALVAEGVLDDAAPVATYVPESAQGGYGVATVRDLLDMTANVRFVEDYEGPDVRRYREAVGQVPSPNSEGIHAYIVSLPAAGDHGRSFSYISPSTDLAGWVCERATGRSLAELITEYVWAPMGGEGDADLLLDRHGAARASGGLCATARDMARIGQLLLQDDVNGAVGLAVADVKKSGDRQAWADGTLSEFLPGAAYRSFWFQPAGESGVLLAAGIHGQRIYVDTTREVVIAQQASLPTSYDDATWPETLPMFQTIARQLQNG